MIMEKRIYWFLGLLITGMFCVSCSENEDVSVQRRVTEAESSLNLIAPNGVKIISDIAELKKKLSEAVETLQEDEFEIVAIDFFPNHIINCQYQSIILYFNKHLPLISFLDSSFSYLKNRIIY